jgi:hypothetical protein
MLNTSRFCFVALALLLLLSLTAQASNNPFINPGFETGDLTGWTPNLTGGSAQVVSLWVPATGPPYAPMPGNHYFLAVGGGAADTDQLVYQSFALNSGDTLSGWAAFDGHDLYPFNDSAAVRIYDGSNNLLATPWTEDINTAGDLASTTPVPWHYTASTGGTYTLQYSSRNGLDGLAPSYGLFDAEQFATPEPGSLALVLLGLPGLAWLRRRRR